jgi:hypothetical protein
MRALEGYFENGQFFAIGRVAPVPERRRVILTVLDEPIQPNVMDAREWLNEFHRLAASGLYQRYTVRRFHHAS